MCILPEKYLVSFIAVSSCSSPYLIVNNVVISVIASTTQQKATSSSRSPNDDDDSSSNDVTEELNDRGSIVWTGSAAAARMQLVAPGSMHPSRTFYTSPLSPGSSYLLFVRTFNRNGHMESIVWTECSWRRVEWTQIVPFHVSPECGHIWFHSCCLIITPVTLF